MGANLHHFGATLRLELAPHWCNFWPNRHRFGAPVSIYYIYLFIVFILNNICVLMDKSFNPTLFEVQVPPSLENDDDLMSVAEKIPAVLFRIKKRTTPFIPAIPLSFLQAIIPAGDSVPLLLVCLAEMRIRGVTEIGIGPSIWLKTGNPSKRIRSRLLHQIGQLPPSLCRIIPRKGRPHLLVAGPNWPKPQNR